MEFHAKFSIFDKAFFQKSVAKLESFVGFWLQILRLSRSATAR